MDTQIKWVEEKERNLLVDKSEEVVRANWTEEFPLRGLTWSAVQGILQDLFSYIIPTKPIMANNTPTGQGLARAAEMDK